MGRARQSVSAEAYGQWNQKKAFTPLNYPKNDGQKARLQQTLQKCFMFAAMEPEEGFHTTKLSQERWAEGAPSADSSKVLHVRRNGTRRRLSHHQTIPRTMGRRRAFS